MLLTRTATALYLLMFFAGILGGSGVAADTRQAHEALAAEDYRTAFDLFMAEARNGDTEAQFQIRRLLDRGRGVDANPEMAFEWFSKAAEQGHPKAQHAVGTYLEEGKGTKRD